MGSARDWSNPYGLIPDFREQPDDFQANLQLQIDALWEMTRKAVKIDPSAEISLVIPDQLILKAETFAGNNIGYSSEYTPDVEYVLGEFDVAFSSPSGNSQNALFLLKLHIYYFYSDTPSKDAGVNLYLWIDNHYKFDVWLSMLRAGTTTPPALTLPLLCSKSIAVENGTHQIKLTFKRNSYAYFSGGRAGVDILHY